MTVIIINYLVCAISHFFPVIVLTLYMTSMTALDKMSELTLSYHGAVCSHELLGKP